jgi:hypothetical protein
MTRPGTIGVGAPIRLMESAGIDDDILKRALAVIMAG